jgi:alpha-L-fucosidase 2
MANAKSFHGSANHSHDRDLPHAIVHRRAPRQWEDGLPLGNGRCGAMVWGDGAPLAFTLDHANLWDLRVADNWADDPDYNYMALRRMVAEGRWDEITETFENRDGARDQVSPTKVYIGRTELDIGQAQQYCCALGLDRAVVEGTLHTAETEHSLCAFVHHDRELLCVRLSDAPMEAELKLHSMIEVCPDLSELNHPIARMESHDQVRVMIQQIPRGLSYAVAWNPVGPDFFMAIEVADSPETARARALETHAAAVTAGFERLLEEHVASWERFWSVSAVHLPEAHMELLWYYGIYLLASCSRPGWLPPGLQGVWAMDGVRPPWRGDYHGDMNVQETFWPAGPSGHVKLMDSWLDHMLEAMPAAQAFTRNFFGTEGAFWVCSTLPYYTMVYGWGTVQFAWSSTAWLASLAWLRWRYSMDEDWLAQVGYPIVAEAFRFYHANLEEGDDGYLHIPLSTSPEYGENRPKAWCSDPNVDIALIRKCCDWLVEMEEALDIETLTEVALTVRRRLVPYALSDDEVLCLWPGKLLDESHRHPSQLMAIHPAMDLTIEDGREARRIIEASVEQYLSLGQYRWTGHTYAQLISFAAVLGQAGWAYDCLLQLAEHWLAPNGLYFNRDMRNSGMTGFRADGNGYGPFTMETNCGLSQGICDMLLQGWRDVVRVFPAVPDHWRDVAFRDLVAEGAFRVSAIRQRGRTVWVQIVAGVGRRLTLRDPFDGEECVISGCDMERDGDDYVADLDAGQEVVLTLMDTGLVSMEQAADMVRCSDTSRIGLR